MEDRHERLPRGATVPDLPDVDGESLRRCYRHAACAAGLPVLELVPDDVVPVIADTPVEGYDAALWDAFAELDLGIWIGTYLDLKPPPQRSLCFESIEDWGDRLRRDGRARLETLGALDD